jgi:hypothetical protein
MTTAPKTPLSAETVNAVVIERTATCWAVIAYRWGWLNNSHYIVRLTTDLQAAKDSADAEATHRGGKYGVTVWDCEANAIYHAPSAYGEKSAHVNWRIDLFEGVGLHVVVALEDGKPMTTEEITKRWQSEKKTREIMERAIAGQPNFETKRPNDQAQRRGHAADDARKTPTT